VHDREYPAVAGNLDVRYPALEYVSAVQDPQRLVISG
jgi:hypothetical protein